MNGMISAHKLMCSSLRPDIAVKFAYAQSQIRHGVVPEALETLYLDSIFSFNYFFEEAPKKMGPSDFLNSFNTLIESLRHEGYSPKEKPVYVTQDGYAVNGAHRVATMAALGGEIPVRLGSAAERYTFSYFANRPGADYFLSHSLITLVQQCPNIRCLILHSSMEEGMDEEILSQLSMSEHIFYSKSFNLSLNAYANLKRINYWHSLPPGERPKWAGTPRSGFSGLMSHARKSTGDSPVRAFFFQLSDNLNLAEVKRSLRAGVENRQIHVVHSTDSHHETLELASALFHEDSRRLLDLRAFTYWSKLDKAIDEIQFGDPSSYAASRNHVLIGGSSSMDAFGLREANDLDFIESTPKYLSGKSFFSKHDLGQELYSGTLDQLAGDPNRHFYYRGLKFVGLTDLAQMKRRRKSSKDLLDAKVITAFLTDNKASSKVTYGRQLPFHLRVLYLLAFSGEQFFSILLRLGVALRKVSKRIFNSD